MSADVWAQISPCFCYQRHLAPFLFVLISRVDVIAHCLLWSQVEQAVRSSTIENSTDLTQAPPTTKRELREQKKQEVEKGFLAA